MRSSLKKDDLIELILKKQGKQQSPNESKPPKDSSKSPKPSKPSKDSSKSPKDSSKNFSKDQLRDMTVKKLKEIGKDLDIYMRSSLKKDDLIRLILKHGLKGLKNDVSLDYLERLLKGDKCDKDKKCKKDHACDQNGRCISKEDKKYYEEGSVFDESEKDENSNSEESESEEHDKSKSEESDKSKSEESKSEESKSEESKSDKSKSEESESEESKSEESESDEIDLDDLEKIDEKELNELQKALKKCLMGK